MSHLVLFALIALAAFLGTIAGSVQWFPMRAAPETADDRHASRVRSRLDLARLHADDLAAAKRYGLDGEGLRRLAFVHEAERAAFEGMNP